MTNIIEVNQDINSKAWKKLLEYIQDLKENGGSHFSLHDCLSLDECEEIHTLPVCLFDCINITELFLYDSKIVRIPREIGKLENLVIFTPYWSYHLCWYPYEIIRCKKIKDTTVSTGVTYGNSQNREEFPDLRKERIEPFEGKIQCSICDKEEGDELFEQYWVTLKLFKPERHNKTLSDFPNSMSADYLPLLTNICSQECFELIEKPSEGYVSYPHKGGPDLKQP